MFVTPQLAMTNAPDVVAWVLLSLRYHYNVANTRVEQHGGKGNDDGLYISSVACCQELWALIMDAGTGFIEQVYSLSNQFLPKVRLCGVQRLGTECHWQRMAFCMCRAVSLGGMTRASCFPLSAASAWAGSTYL